MNTRADLITVQKKTHRLAIWAVAIRPGQWLKNLLVFLPLFLSGKFMQPTMWLPVLWATAGFTLITAGNYLINDLLDKNTDSLSPTKHNRPVASGAISTTSACIMGVLMSLTGLGLLFFLDGSLGLWGAIYLVGALFYSLIGKRIRMVDVLFLGAFYTCRVGLGMSAIDDPLSPWLVGFCLIFFASLGMLKRVSELVGMETIQGRSYQRSDFHRMKIIAIALLVTSAAVFARYMSERDLVSGIYKNPAWLWLALAVVALWCIRALRFAVQGKMRADPMEFALHDWVSWATGSSVVLFIVLAHIA